MSGEGLQLFVIFSNCYLLDIDECKGDDVCPANSHCINTAGSFRCSCDLGYTGSSTGTAGAAGCSRMLHAM